MAKILITGAASAIAQATARIWASQGASFYLVDRNEEKVKAVARDLLVRGAKSADYRALDLVELSEHEQLVNDAVKKLGGSVDMVLIAHGYLGRQERAEQDFWHAKKIIKINYVSAVSLMTVLANRLAEQGSGVMAVISSVAGDRGRQSVYIYGAAKGALSVFSDGLRNRLVEKGVHVMTIKPGYVDTPMTAHVGKKGLLWVKPEMVARDIVKAVRQRKDVLYTPWFWRWIMLVIKLIPERIFKRMSL